MNVDVDVATGLREDVSVPFVTIKKVDFLIRVFQHKLSAEWSQ